MSEINIPSTVSTDSIPIQEAPTELAFHAIWPEIKALPETAALPVNIDVVAAATTVLGLLPELKALRPQIAEELKHFNLERFDKLEQYALALSHAYGVHRGSIAVKGNAAELGAELTATRDRLFVCAQALAVHGYMDAKRFAHCKTAIGYRATAADIFTLVPLFKESWSQIVNKTPVTLAELNGASSLAVELLAEVGMQDQSPVSVGEAAQTRAKAYTLFVRAYDDARRAVQYLRADYGDADDITPSLYAGRGGRGKTEAAAAGTTSSTAPNAPAAAANEPASTVKVNNPNNLPIDSPLTN
jgi:hypothetical protein